MRFVVEGVGQWAENYLDAFKAVRNASSVPVNVVFTYDSSFGSGPLPSSISDRIKRIKEAGFACIDTCDTRYETLGRRYAGRTVLPEPVHAVFVVTPDRTHCDVAEYWLGKAKYVLIEKPFDVSTMRVEDFKTELAGTHGTAVYGIDHYLVRCNPAAEYPAELVRHCLGLDQNGAPTGCITSFEFCMTEPPRYVDGKYDDSRMRDRIHSIQEGMVFDMGSHALPVLLPFFDPNSTISIQRTWAGVSENLRDVMYKGRETFSVAEVECTTISLDDEQHPLPGRIIVGKDVGQRESKYLRLTGPGGTIRLDLVARRFFREEDSGDSETEIGLMEPDWCRFLVDSVVRDTLPPSVQRFGPGFGAFIIDFIGRWRDACIPRLSSPATVLSGYAPGVDVRDLCVDKYSTKQEEEQS